MTDKPMIFTGSTSTTVTLPTLPDMVTPPDVFPLIPPGTLVTIKGLTWEAVREGNHWFWELKGE
jgi:hypothetical protein